MTLPPWVRLPIFGHEIEGEWIGECRTEEAQDKSAKKERHGVGHDLFIDRAETHIMPVEGGAVRSADEEGTDPVSGAEDRDQGPGIVEKGAYHERKKLRPNAQVQKITMTVCNPLGGEKAMKTPMAKASAVRCGDPADEGPVSAAIEMKGSWPWPSWMKLVT